MKNLAIYSMAALFLVTSVLAVHANEAKLGGLRLLPGYSHIPLQGFDSIVGRIEKKDGLRISYEIGAVVKPGEPRFGGSFSDRPKLTPADKIHWYREQKVNGVIAHLAHRKDDILLVSFPEKGMNMSVKVSSSAEMAEALLIILTYPGAIPPPSERIPRQPTY